VQTFLARAESSSGHAVWPAVRSGGKTSARGKNLHENRCGTHANLCLITETFSACPDLPKPSFSGVPSFCLLVTGQFRFLLQAISPENVARPLFHNTFCGFPQRPQREENVCLIIFPRLFRQTFAASTFSDE
jgi:hypothetical protein